MGKTKAFISGLLVGGVAAGAYVFLRSTKGQQFTRDLTDQAARMGETWKELNEDGELLKDAVERLKEEGKRALDQITLGKQQGTSTEDVTAEDVASDSVDSEASDETSSEPDTEARIKEELIQINKDIDQLEKKQD
ncbi:MAG: hypothetical protein ACRC5C_00760 [Bacilli bacterium]